MSWSRWFHTVRHLRAQQIAGRLRRYYVRESLDLHPAPPLRPIDSGRWSAPLPRPASLLGPVTFRFLHCTRDLASANAWNDASCGRLWLYHMHYLDDLRAQDAEERLAWQEGLIDRWIRENPPLRGAGWEPYPTSRRIVNWIVWHLGPGALSNNAVHSLAAQARHLAHNLETDLLGNHLLANATALFFAGIFFAGPEAARWEQLGRALLTRELHEQVLPDGGHVERSPMYHALVLEDLLDVLNLCAAANRTAEKPWSDATRRMLDWLAVLTHPDGGYALFNDAALDGARQVGALYDYASRLGLDVARRPVGPGLVHLRATGYLRLEAGPLVALLDAAPLGPDYQPGHGHADTLTFEASLWGVRTIVDTGTSLYAEGPERLRQRGTPAHNTVIMDEADSSELWKSFRVARRARVVECTTSAQQEEILVHATHDGYARLPGVGLHGRTWRLVDGGLHIIDAIQGSGRHTVEIPFHLHPDIRVEQADEGRFEISHEDRGLLAILVLDDGLSATIEATTYHDELGVTRATFKVVGLYIGDLPARFTCTLHPHTVATKGAARGGQT